MQNHILELMVMIVFYLEQEFQHLLPMEEEVDQDMVVQVVHNTLDEMVVLAVAEVDPLMIIL